MTYTAEIKGTEEVQKLLNDLPVWAYDGARKSLNDYVKSVDASIKTQISGVDLNVRSGFLRRSFNFEVHGTSLNTLGASNYTDAIYAPIHQVGGTIFAKNAYKGVPGGPYLNIPTPANQTPSGVMRYSAQQVFADGGYVLRTKASWKAPYVVMLKGKAMFALVKFVAIPKRMKFTETAEAGVPTLLSELANSWLNPAGA